MVPGQSEAFEARPPSPPTHSEESEKRLRHAVQRLSELHKLRVDELRVYMVLVLCTSGK
jgi:hypothetical protein